MPSIVGGIVSVFVTASKPYLGNQWFWQLCALVVTLFVAILAGLLTGKVIRYYESRNQDKFLDFDESDWLSTGVVSADESASFFSPEDRKDIGGGEPLGDLAYGIIPSHRNTNV